MCDSQANPGGGVDRLGEIHRSGCAPAHVAPAIATAIAKSHMRMRRQSPTTTASVIAPMVQKLDAIGDRTENNREREGEPGDFAGECPTSCMRAIISRTSSLPLNPDGADASVYR